MTFYRFLGPGVLCLVALGAAEAQDERLVPLVGYPVHFGVSRPVRDLPTPREHGPTGAPREVPNPSLGQSRKPPIKKVVAPGSPDQALDAPAGRGRGMPAPRASFEGLHNADNPFVVLPPDTNGDIGPHHYVQAVNLVMRVYDRAGAPLSPVFQMSDLFPSGPCHDHGSGDPVVLYDHLADRWLLSQFSLPGFPFPPFYQCIAVSQTGDPAGAWFAYTYPMPGAMLNDYSKFGVWPHAYFMTDVQFFAPGFGYNGTGLFAFDRARMLAGDPLASVIYLDLSAFDLLIGGLLPADLDGPPRDRPHLLACFTAAEFGDPRGDGLRLFEFVPDFQTPAHSSFRELPFLPVALFDPVPPPHRNAIPQPGTDFRLDALGDRLLHRLQYRAFSAHESLVVNHTVDVSGDPNRWTYRAGVRYYELRRPLAGGAWSIHEQASYAPADGVHRWMGSAALDNDGNLAVGFNVVDPTATFPGVRYAGRLATDPPGGLFQGEEVLVAGGRPQLNGSYRWGDYSMLGVDPADDCTFWFTGEYYSATNPGCPAGFEGVCWQTRVGSFRFPSCTPPPAPATLSGRVRDGASGNLLAGAFVSAGGGYSTVTGTAGSYSLSVAPGTYDITASSPGYRSTTVPGRVVASGGAATADIDLTPSPTLLFNARAIHDLAGNGNGQVDPNECVGLDVYLRNAGGTPASGILAQLHTSTPNVTITAGHASYTDLAPGAAGGNTTAFRFETSPGFVPGTTIDLSLDIETDQGPFTVRFTVPSGTASGAASDFHAAGPVPIPAVGVADLNITVAGLDSPIAKVRLATHITHGWGGELEMRLIGPDGTNVLLNLARGDHTFDFGRDCPSDDGDDTVFDDEADIPIRLASGDYVGSFRPDQPLAGFNGKAGGAANGIWTFRVTDTVGESSGAIQCVTLFINEYLTASAGGGCGPRLSIADVSVNPEAATHAVFTVALTPAAPGAVTVAYATADGTASAGADYTPASGTLTFAPGETAKAVQVPILADALDEIDETFRVDLSNATGGATLADGRGVGTIRDDDGSGYYTITPCRLLDTRATPPALSANSTRGFTITGGPCGVPADAKAVMLNVTVVGPGDFGNLRLYPTGQPEPLSSTINFAAGRTRANNAIVPLGVAGQVSVRCDMPAGSTGRADLVLDAYGYFK